LPALGTGGVFFPVVLIEILARIEVSATDFTVEFVRVCHTDLPLDYAARSVLHESLSERWRHRTRQN